VANPVYAGGGKRHACETLDKKRQWLLERAERNGFLLEENSFDIVGSDTVKFCRGRNHKHEVTLSRVTFEGALSIADAEPFKTALVQGIGHAKAYGCGMLTIAGLQ
jgi:CRISPR system Cascade subunit CasE